MKKEKKEVQVEQEPEEFHTRPNRRKQLLVSLLIISFLLIATTGVVLYGKGYRFLVKQGEPQVTKTGILNITSDPTGAQIYLNDLPSPSAATNSSLNLTPGKHKVKVAKDGYTDWIKDIEIKKEEVSSTTVRLFPKAPTLQSISTLGIESVVVDPSGTKLAFNIASQSAKRNGIYVVDMTSRAFPILIGQSSSTQIADDAGGVAFSEASISWSPDGKQILAGVPVTPETTAYYLLDSTRLNEAPQDVTATLQIITDQWDALIAEKENALSRSLKPNVRKFADQNFRVLAWSPDESKILYQASVSAQMPVFMTPRRIGNNHLYERRDLEEKAIYVYNIKEDINTRVTEPVSELCSKNDLVCTMSSEENAAKENPFTWFPDSTHLIYVHDKRIDVVEDDGSNLTTLYAGPFVDQYAIPWPDGSKIVILTNLNNTAVSPTLYTIGLR